MTEDESGHRTVPHTADLRVEAWAPTREGCIAQAVTGVVESFLDTTAAPPENVRRLRLTADTDEDLLVAVLEEVIYLVDTAGEAPAGVELERAGEGVDVRFAMVDARRLPQVGAVPKAVSLHELYLAAGPRVWTCSVTLDV